MLRGIAQAGGLVAEEQPILLSSLPASRAQRWAASGAAALLFALFVAAEMYGDAPGPTAPGFAGLTAGAESTSFLMTATLLFALFSIRRLRSLLVLAAGYLFTSLMLVSWCLTFPGIFASSLFGAGAQASFYLAMLVVVGPAVTAIAYVACGAGGEGPTVSNPGRVILVTLALMAALAMGMTWAIVTAGDRLPPMMLDSVHVSPLWRQIAPLVVVIYVVAAVAVAFGSGSIVETWLAVSLWSWTLESFLLLRFGARYSFRWYVSVFFEFFSAGVVLAALLSQVTTLYARLAISTRTQRRERENRLLAVDAALASVAHQTYQPISAIMTNAHAAQRALARTNPDVAEIRAVLTDIVADGHRATDAIDAVRAIFRTDGGGRTALDVADLVSGVLILVQSDLKARQIVVETTVDRGLPCVVGNKSQLQQVLFNLIANAAEAMDQLAARTRRLRIAAVREGDNVLVTLQDNGPGLDPKLGESVFDPFVTTKAGGTGLGLSICRSIVEAHGGSLCLMAGQSNGAVAEFALPVAKIRRAAQTENEAARGF
jgi:signal transduction histidine kinase